MTAASIVEFCMDSYLLFRFVVHIEIARGIFDPPKSSHLYIHGDFRAKVTASFFYVDL
jgi:hypothetical protein